MSVRAAQKTQRMSAFRSQFVTQMQMHKYVYRTADSEHCFDLSDLISAVGVTDIYSRQYTPEKKFFTFTVERVGQRVFFRVLVTGIVTNRKQKIPSQVYIALSKCRS